MYRNILPWGTLIIVELAKGILIEEMMKEKGARHINTLPNLSIIPFFTRLV